MNVGGALKTLPLTSSSTPDPDWDAKRRISQYLLCVTPQALYCLHAQAPQWGILCAQAQHLNICVKVPCVSVPSSLPTSDPVKMGEGSHACGCWKLKGQKATYESVDCMFSLL